MTLTPERPAMSSPAVAAAGADATTRQFVITLGCRDRTGIVALLAGFFASMDGSIVEAAYHADRSTGWFFTRQAVAASSIDLPAEELRRRFTTEVADQLGPDTQWSLTDSAIVRRVALLVSREGHCLDDIVARAYRREFNARVVCVIGNHPELGDLTGKFGIPFHLVSFESDAPFESIARTIAEYDVDTIVLARFMRVLPAWLCDEWAGRALNIHHSFLPAFAGARPYKQAHERGVKLIGATCHYVTADLDAGPIVEQDVVRINHTHAVADIVRQGRDVEKSVLAKGLRWHLENRIVVHGDKTVVFG